jgi:thiamine-phosphate pyrophosphorylase
MPNHQTIRGLYAVTPDQLMAEDTFGKIRMAIAGGARVVQYRDKTATPATRLVHALALRAVVKKAGALFIVNDSIELAVATDADGVHLGKDDIDPQAARMRLPGKLLGVSCYKDVARAIDAENCGADYVSFGAVFPSPTKPDAVHAPLALFHEAKRKLSIPVVAIGGITVANAGAVIAAGASAIAVISGLFDTDDIRARAADLSAHFTVEY